MTSHALSESHSLELSLLVDTARAGKLIAGLIRAHLRGIVLIGERVVTDYATA